MQFLLQAKLKKVPNNHHVQIVDTYSKNKTELTLKNDSLEFGMARFTHKQQLKSWVSLLHFQFDEFFQTFETLYQFSDFKVNFFRDYAPFEG